MMNRQRPFAWLRHFTMNADGSTTFGKNPRSDDAFKRELKEFSDEQSKKLCDRKQICGTIDAHYAVLTGAPLVKPPDSYTIYANRDLYGGDIDGERLTSIDLAGCEARCQAHGKCLAYTFNKWKNVCFLKDKIGSVRIEPSATTGVRSDLPAPAKATEPIGIQRCTGRRFPGTQYSTSTVGLGDCESACLGDERCMAFNFFRINDRCVLLSEVEAPTADTRADCGLKIQPYR
jgi:hypothetical protein